MVVGPGSDAGVAGANQTCACGGGKRGALDRRLLDSKAVGTQHVRVRDLAREAGAIGQDEDDAHLLANASNMAAAVRRFS